MFIPNTTALLHRMNGRNPFGRAIFDPAVPIKVGVVDLGDLVTPSQVRADQSASRGAADIDTIKTATILVPKNIVVKNGDVIEIDGFHVKVSGIMPRRNVLGQLDHWQIAGSIQAGDL
jgi:hypothetical protein